VYPPSNNAGDREADGEGDRVGADEHRPAWSCKEIQPFHVLANESGDADR
jgi:hypothetical protein